MNQQGKADTNYKYSVAYIEASKTDQEYESRQRCVITLT
jgi:hypothetical protein